MEAFISALLRSPVGNDVSLAHTFVRVNNQNSKAYNDLYTITLALKEYMNVTVFKSGSTCKMQETLILP